MIKPLLLHAYLEGYILSIRLIYKIYYNTIVLESFILPCVTSVTSCYRVCV